jgi:hypothetical protein
VEVEIPKSSLNKPEIKIIVVFNLPIVRFIYVSYRLKFHVKYYL